MPELAELRLTANLINHASQGFVFVNIHKNPIHKWTDIEKPFNSFSITAESRGKELMLTLHDSASFEKRKLLMTMGMSGHFVCTDSNKEPKHAHLKFHTNSNKTLSFVDVRRFGKWKWVNDWSTNRGPDPTTQYEEFKKNILDNINSSALSAPIYLFLMNQQYCNGIGNYLRSELLYRLPNLNPNTPAKEAFILHPTLFQLCRDIPLQAYALGGGQLKSWETPFINEPEPFLKFIRCYSNPLMKRVKDKNGRTFWYDPKWANLIL